MVAILAANLLAFLWAHEPLGGDAWAYEPYECFVVEYPDGWRTSFGRVARSGVSWNEEFEVFTVNSDVEETATRSEDISIDYDFFHSHTIALACGGDYPVKIIPQDINLWTARLFLGAADGFSILYLCFILWAARSRRHLSLSITGTAPAMTGPDP